MKTAACALILGCVAYAEEPCLTTVGTSLEAVSVRADPDSLRTDSARAVAESYARYIAEQRAAHVRFAGLFRKAHVGILRRYYVAVLVQKQADAYAKSKAPAMQCRVVSVTGNEAVLLRAWSGGKRRMRLVLAEQDGKWRVATVLHEQDGAFVEAGLGVPPRPRKIGVPRPPRMRRNSPKTTIQSLRGDMLRLRFLQQRGEQRLQQAVASVLTRLLGAGVVAREQERSAKQTARLPRTFHVSDPSPAVDGVVRMGVVATEPVPGVKAQTTAVGHAGFDLVKTREGPWRITAELTRAQPDEPLQKLDGFFGLFFLR